MRSYNLSRKQLDWEVERNIRCWTAAFKLCDGIKSVRNRWLAEIPFP